MTSTTVSAMFAWKVGLSKEGAAEITASGLGCYNVHEAIPKPLQREDEGFNVIKCVDEGIGMNEGVEAVDRGGHLSRLSEGILCRRE